MYCFKAIINSVTDAISYTDSMSCGSGSTGAVIALVYFKSIIDTISCVR
jgi:hypothetical protein